MVNTANGEIMNTRHSNHTGRPHRTLESAFGPYTSRYIEEPHDPMPTADKILVIGSLAVLALVVGLVMMGVIV